MDMDSRLGLGGVKTGGGGGWQIDGKGPGCGGKRRRSRGRKDQNLTDKSRRRGAGG